MEKERLFSEFPPVTADTWKDKIVEDLKGADYEKKMVWKTNEGFSVNPFYRKEDVNTAVAAELPGEYPYTRGNSTHNKWLIRTEIVADDAAVANSKAIKMIKEGVTAIGDYTFYNCSKLASITLPDGITSIGKGAFYNCNALTGFTVPKQVPIELRGHNMVAEIADFIDAVKNGKPAPISPLEGASTVAVARATVNAAACGKAVKIKYPKY